MKTATPFRGLFVPAAVVFLATSAWSASAADFKLASIFSDGMVVQRNQKVPVWGEGAPNASVDVQFGPQHATAKVGADGRWRADLAALPVGGPYTLKAASGGRSATVQDILSGDVWICSGQSNMQFSTKEAIGGPEAAAASGDYPNLRLLTMGRGGAPAPSRSFNAKWQHATPKSAEEFSAVGYFFGLGLLKDPALKNVPLGLINSSFGGTAVEAWTPKEELAGVKPDQMSASMFNIPPAALYNGMIAPLVPCGLTGVVWYQGEANSGKPENYAQLLGALIKGWRTVWARPDLPFLIVQLPPYSGKTGGHFFTWLREAQATVASTVPKTDLVVTIDTTDGSNLHPKDKEAVGQRAALLARRDVYGEKIAASGPALKAVRIEGSKVLVTFDTHGKGLAGAADGSLRGFEIAGDDGEYSFTTARLNGDTIALESENVPAPKTVRYAWAGVPHADLHDTTGLPAAPFRTDKLPAEDLEFQAAPVMRRISSPSYELLIDGDGKVTSFGVRGEQFFSNRLGADGGTSIPGWLGPRSLSRFQELGQRRVVFRDDDVSLEILCQNDVMDWKVKNDGKAEVEFRIALASQVEVAKNGAAAELRRGKSRLLIEGLGDLGTPAPDGRRLTVKIKPHGLATLHFSTPK